MIDFLLLAAGLIVSVALAVAIGVIFLEFTVTLLLRELDRD